MKENYWLTKPNIIQKELNNANSRLKRISISEIINNINNSDIDVSNDEAMTFLIECIAPTIPRNDAIRIYEQLHNEYLTENLSIYNENYTFMHKYSSMLVMLSEDDPGPKKAADVIKQAGEGTSQSGTSDSAIKKDEKGTASDSQLATNKTAKEASKDFYNALIQLMKSLGTALKSGVVAICKVVVALGKKLKIMKSLFLIFGIIWTCRPLMAGPWVASALGLSASLSLGTVAIIACILFVAYWVLKGLIFSIKEYMIRKDIRARMFSGISEEQATFLVRKYDPFVNIILKKMNSEQKTQLHKYISTMNGSIEEKFKILQSKYNDDGSKKDTESSSTTSTPPNTDKRSDVLQSGEININDIKNKMNLNDMDDNNTYQDFLHLPLISETRLNYSMNEYNMILDEQYDQLLSEISFMIYGYDILDEGLQFKNDDTTDTSAFQKIGNRLGGIFSKYRESSDEIKNLRSLLNDKNIEGMSTRELSDLHNTLQNFASNIGINDPSYKNLRADMIKKDEEIDNYYPIARQKNIDSERLARRMAFANEREERGKQKWKEQQTKSLDKRDRKRSEAETRRKESNVSLLKRFKDFITDPEVRTQVMDLFKKKNSKGEKGFFWKIANFSTFALANGYNQLAKLWNNFNNKYLTNDNKSLDDRLKQVNEKIHSYQKLANNAEDDDERKRIEITLNRLYDERDSINTLLSNNPNKPTEPQASAEEATEQPTEKPQSPPPGTVKVDANQSYFKNFYRMRMLEV